MKIFNIDLRADQLNLSHLYPYTEWTHCPWFRDGVGREHYKLLAYLSTQCESGETIYDIGTYMGLSALALAYNPNVHVVTYDIVDNLPADKKTIRQYPNITYKIADCTSKDEIVEIAKAPIVLLDVDPHDGVQEPKIFSALVENGFRGLLFLDDIHLNEGMRNWWNSIPYKKYDLTKYGHYSGTGVVVFDDTRYDVRMM